MDKTTLKAKTNKKIVPKEILDRKQFLKLPLSERTKILKEQAAEILEHYKNDNEWKEFQALDIYEY